MSSRAAVFGFPSPFATVLSAVAIALSACNLVGHTHRTTSPRVLGAPSETPPVVGQPAPVGTGELDAVSCGSPSRCWAVGISSPDQGPTRGTSAAATATSAVVVASRDGGATWKAQRITDENTPQLSGISCPDSTRCMAVGSNGSSLLSATVLRTLDAGATWSPATSPPDGVVVTSLACTNPQECVAIVIGSSSTWAARSVDFGTSWQTEGDLPTSFQPGNDLTCISGGTCLVAGSVPAGNGHSQGAVAFSADSGQTWALSTTPPGTGVLRGTACPSPSVCVVAGSTSTTLSDVVAARGELLRSSDGGHSWKSSATPPVDDVHALSCPSAQQCAMVGGSWVGFPAVDVGAVARSTDGGASFSSAKTAYAPLALAAVTCPTTSHCVAVGGDTVVRITLAAPASRPGAGSA